MVLSLAVIVVLMVASVAVTGLCSFDPGRPENGPVREVDPSSYLSTEAMVVDFAVRNPEVPEGWTPNSARRTMIDEAIVPVVGYVTSGEGYLQLYQSGVDLEDLARGTDDDARLHTGDREIAGVSVQEWTSDDEEVEPLWAADLGDARIAVTGAADEGEFVQLIEQVVGAEPLPGATDAGQWASTVASTPDTTAGA